MARIAGASNHSARLRGAAGPKAAAFLGRALFKAGQLVEQSAALSITDGATSDANHVASLPGEAPNADTHVLDRSIETNKVQPLKVEVSANAPYAAALEFGSERKAGKAARTFAAKSGKFGPVLMEFGDSATAARPFMAPALQKNRKAVTDLIEGAINRVNSVNGAKGK